jgi:hypothetical protein
MDIDPMEQHVRAKVSEIAKVLGLPADTDIDAVLEKIASFQKLGEELVAFLTEQGVTPPTQAHSAAPDPTRYVPIGDYQRAVGELNKLRQGISVQAAETHVSGLIRGGHIAPFMKDWSVNLCSINKSSFDDFVANVSPLFQKLVTPQGRGGVPSAHSSQTLDDTEREVCSRMGITHEAFAKTNPRT